MSFRNRGKSVRLRCAPLRMTERESAHSRRSRRLPIFLRLKPLSRDALRFIGSEEDKNIGYVSGIRPFRRILLGFRGAMHRRVHTSGIDPIDAHIRVFQFRCPRLRHSFKAEFRDAISAPAWITNLTSVAGYVDDRTAALDHRWQRVFDQ